MKIHLSATGLKEESYLKEIAKARIFLEMGKIYEEDDTIIITLISNKGKYYALVNYIMDNEYFSSEAKAKSLVESLERALKRVKKNIEKKFRRNSGEDNKGLFFRRETHLALNPL